MFRIDLEREMEKKDKNGQTLQVKMVGSENLIIGNFGL